MKALLILALATTAFAQQQEIVVERAVPAVGAMRATQVFRGAVNPVKGAPYAAEAITETVQRLADGTRITNTTTTKTYRDSEGRTRTDVTVKALGPWVREGGEEGSVITTIHDPVKGEHHTLHHSNKSATSSGARTVIAHDIRGEVDRQVRVEVDKRAVTVRDAAAGPVGDVLMPGPGAMAWTHEGAGVGSGLLYVTAMDGVQTKALGKRVIEGVECDGTLITTTIPEGRIGNDRAIEATTETWKSPSLKIDVLRKHSDPRFGETNYRLVNLVRAEQPRTLFEVPPDYEVKELSPSFNVPVERLKQFRERKEEN